MCGFSPKTHFVITVDSWSRDVTPAKSGSVNSFQAGEKFIIAQNLFYAFFSCTSLKGFLFQCHHFHSSLCLLSLLDYWYFSPKCTVLFFASVASVLRKNILRQQTFEGTQVRLNFIKCLHFNFIDSEMKVGGSKWSYTLYRQPHCYCLLLSASYTVAHLS